MASPAEGRFQVVAPPEHVDEFRKAAAHAGLSLSAWVGQACLEKLPKKVVSQLPERQGVGRPAKTISEKS